MRQAVITILALICTVSWGQETGVQTYQGYGNPSKKVGAWSPRSISGLAFWFDASDQNTLTLSGSDITQWDDKSSNGRDLTPGTNSPSWAANTITLDKSNSENLRNAGAWTMTQPHTTVVVYTKTVSKDVAGYIIGSNTGSPIGGLIGTGTSGTGTWILHSGTGWNVQTNDLNTNIQVVVFNGAATKFYLNDDAVDTGDAGANAMTGIEIGSYNDGAVYFDAELFEVIGYSGAISDADRGLLIDYLQAKWGL